MDEFNFQMVDEEPELTGDANDWGNLARFVVQHPTEMGCARPTYVRVTLAYSRRVMAALGEPTLFGRFVTWIYNNLPILIGCRGTMCTQCHGVVIHSSIAAWLMDFFFSMVNEETVRLLVLPCDTHNIPENKREEFYSGS